MATYGIRMYDYAGTKVTYDSDMVAWNQVTSFDAPNTQNNYIPFTLSPYASELMVMVFFKNSPPLNKPAYLPARGLTTTAFATSVTNVTDTATGVTTTYGESIIGLVLMR